MMKKSLLIIVGVLLAAIFGLVMLKNAMVGALISTGISSAIHVPVQIGKTEVSFTKSSIRLDRLRVGNPAGFDEPLLADAPLISIDFNPSALIQKRTAHFESVTLDLKEIVIVKNKEGKLNVQSLGLQKEEKGKDSETKPKKDQKPGIKLMIDKLDLSIGRVVYKDFSGGGQPKIQTFDIQIKNRQFQNIDNPQALISLTLLEALTKAGLSKLLSVDFLKGQLTGVLSNGYDLIGDSTDAVGGTAKSLLGLFK